MRSSSQKSDTRSGAHLDPPERRGILEDDRDAARVSDEVRQLAVIGGDDHLHHVAGRPEPDRRDQGGAVRSADGQDGGGR